MNTKIVYIIGDVHGELGQLNKFINTKIRQHAAIKALAEDCQISGNELEVLLLQCGDMAYFWPGYDNWKVIKNDVSFVKDGRVKIYWCAGNHEDHDRLDTLFPLGSKEDLTNIAEVDEGVFYCRFGATLDLADSLTVLFAGGAESADKAYRLGKMAEGCPRIWWPQEGISEEELDRLDAVPKADWVISHTAPYSFNLAQWFPGSSLSPGHLDEPSRAKLDNVLWKYQPKKWFFGHFHKYMQGVYDLCEWEGLADIRSPETYYTYMKI